MQASYYATQASESTGAVHDTAIGALPATLIQCRISYVSQLIDPITSA